MKSISVVPLSQWIRV